MCTVTRSSSRELIFLLVLSIMGITLPVIAMQPGNTQAVTDLYIIPVASADNTNENVAERPWQILFTRDKTWCCGQAEWRFLHIPIKNLSYFGGLRSLFGKFVLDPVDADKKAYQALAQLTHDRLSEGTALYYTLIRGLKDQDKNAIQPQSPFSVTDKNAQYFFIPVEYVSNVSLNPRKKSEAEFMLQWLTPEVIEGLEKGAPELIEDKAVTILKTYWHQARESIVAKIQELEEANREHRIITLIKEQSPEKRWDQLQNTLPVNSSSKGYNLLDPNNGRFSCGDKSYDSPMTYYKTSELCKKDGSVQRVITCKIKNLFVANVCKFQQSNDARRQLMDTGKKILIYPDINDSLAGVGAHYRGLNNQGRILMYIRDNYSKIKIAKKESDLEVSFSQYIQSNSPYSIPSLFAQHNWRNRLMRWIIRIRAGELFGYSK